MILQAVQGSAVVCIRGAAIANIVRHWIPRCVVGAFALSCITVATIDHKIL